MLMRKTMNIQFDSYDMVEKFSRDVAGMPGEFDLASGRRSVDAKSFLGIFSLDLSRPVILTAVTDDVAAIEKLRAYQL